MGHAGTRSCRTPSIIVFGVRNPSHMRQQSQPNDGLHLNEVLGSERILLRPELAGLRL